MSNSIILNNKRQLSQEEQVKLAQALSKWYPKLIETYNTPIYDMMASPLKITIIHSILLAIVIFVTLVVNQKFGFLPGLKSKNLFKMPMIYIIIVVVLLVIGYLSYYSQYQKNENLTLMLTLTKPGATKYDYESSNVIQSKLFRNSMGRGGSSIGSGMAGGVIGYGLGSSGKSRSRSRTRRGRR
jgi:hypothetical protein